MPQAGIVKSAKLLLIQRRSAFAVNVLGAGQKEMGVIALISLPRNFCRKPLFGTTLGTF
jgi:hypothetical protein